jgi:hypothetical protein
MTYEYEHEHEHEHEVGLRVGSESGDPMSSGSGQ